jgi:hypothetical protein
MEVLFVWYKSTSQEEEILFAFTLPLYSAPGYITWCLSKIDSMCNMKSFFFMKYVGSFPVDDCCLDDQMQPLHTQLKSLKVGTGNNKLESSSTLRQVLTVHKCLWWRWGRAHTSSWSGAQTTKRAWKQ